MSFATKIIEEAYKKNKGIILVLFPTEPKGRLSTLAVHLSFVNGSHMPCLGLQSSLHHHKVDEELEISGKPNKLVARLKSNPKIKVDVNGFYFNRLSINTYALVVPYLTSTEQEVLNLLKRSKAIKELRTKRNIYSN